LGAASVAARSGLFGLAGWVWGGWPWAARSGRLGLGCPVWPAGSGTIPSVPARSGDAAAAAPVLLSVRSPMGALAGCRQLADGVPGGHGDGAALGQPVSECDAVTSCTPRRLTQYSTLQPPVCRRCAAGLNRSVDAGPHDRIVDQSVGRRDPRHPADPRKRTVTTCVLCMAPAARPQVPLMQPVSHLEIETLSGATVLPTGSNGSIDHPLAASAAVSRPWDGTSARSGRPKGMTQPS
jgi:hypothetical protein